MTVTRRASMAGSLGIALALCTATDAVSRPGQPVSAQTDAGPATSPPAALIGNWQLRVDGRQFKLRNSYTVEIRIGDGRHPPVGLVSYFAGDPERPSTICRTQLEYLGQQGAASVFGESLNYRMGRDPCPIWGEVAIEWRDGQPWFQWRKAGTRKPSVRMEGAARRPGGGAECRSVGADSPSGGRVFCRTPDGDWLPRPG